MTALKISNSTDATTVRNGGRCRRTASETCLVAAFSLKAGPAAGHAALRHATPIWRSSCCEM